MFKQENATAREPDRVRTAFLWMAVSGLGFALMGLLVKLLSSEVPQFQLVFFRSAVNFLIQLCVVLALSIPLFPANKPLLFFRGVMGFLGLSCFFYAISLLPLSVSAILNWTSPIFVILFSALLLKEHLAPKAFLSIGLAFLGVILLVQPEGWFGGLDSPAIRWDGVLIGIFGAAFAGMAYVAVRAATARVGVNIIILYFTGTASVLSAPLALLDFKIPDNRLWLQLVGLGVFAAIGQFAMTQGYRYARAGLVGTMSLMNAGFMALFGWLVLGEDLNFLQWIGILVLGIGVGSITLYGRREKLRK